MNDYKELIAELYAGIPLLCETRPKTAEVFKKCLAAITQLVNERDAAIKDLADSDLCCQYCKHDGDEKHCKHCSPNIDLWEWRGVQ